MAKEDLLSQEVRQQRRALSLAWSAAGSLVILAGFAGWQWKVAVDNERAAIEQRRVAQQQRDRAEHTLESATRSANSLVYDFAARFENSVGMPVELVKDILDRALALQDQLIASNEVTPELQRSQAMALLRTGEVLLTLGKTTSALAAVDRARQITEALLAVKPENTVWRHDLSAVLEKLGDVLERQGNPEQALKARREVLAINLRLVATNADNAHWDESLFEFLQQNWRFTAGAR